MSFGEGLAIMGFNCRISLHRYLNGELSAAPSSAILEVLREQTYRPADDPAWAYHVFFQDGGEIIFVARGLEKNAAVAQCYFQYRSLDDRVARLMYDIARAGDFVMMPEMKTAEGSPILLTRKEQEEHVPKNLYFSTFTEKRIFYPVHVASAEELRAFLDGGLGPWHESHIIRG